MEERNLRKSNRLIHESSPYLLQHAENPVDWFPWGQEALDKAIKEDKMLLVSIGYSACHWCHVMEHESFEDEEVAQIMNDNFVCIKVDREERPDVDQVYMDAVQLITQHGGWPLNCFALPNGSPVYGGTYFPKSNWVELLKYLAGMYAHEKEKLLEQAQQIKKGIRQIGLVGFRPFNKNYSEGDIHPIFETMEKGIDTQWGGTKGAPKFPMPVSWSALLRYAYFAKKERILNQVRVTLDAIAAGGIFDHLGGGFARYSVDEKWFAPHFEKMLYDNAQLISLYSEAFQVFSDQNYRQVVYRSIEFIRNELTSEEGVFYSALDADSEGEEGKYYTWGKQEIDALLGEGSDLFCKYFKITDDGNWEENRNILYKDRDIQELSEQFMLSVPEIEIRIEAYRNKMLQARNLRIKPNRDDKILTAWNGLMIKGLTDAYRAFGDEDFLRIAIRAANFILEKQTAPDGSLFRNYKNGKSSISGFLDDYASIIDALASLYRCTFDEHWLALSNRYVDYVMKYFWDEETSMFFYTHALKQELVVRKMETSDNVIASSNSIIANNLFLLGKYFDNKDYLRISGQMLSNVCGQVLRYPWYYSNWSQLLITRVYLNKEIVVAGPDALSKGKELLNYYLPDIALAASPKGSALSLFKDRYVPDKTLFYVCENFTCNYPVGNVGEAISLINA
jgi:uncharacterized protein